MISPGYTIISPVGCLCSAIARNPRIALVEFSSDDY